MHKILYQIPYPETQYANRSIYQGYKRASKSLGHEFLEFTATDSLQEVLTRYKPSIFITFLSPFHSRFINYELLLKARRKTGLKVVTFLPYWNSPIAKWRINEAPSLSKNNDHIQLIRYGLAGDVYASTCERWDGRMVGFAENLKIQFNCIPLAADNLLPFNQQAQNDDKSISYIGTNLPQKHQSFNELLFPLKSKYSLSIYGQDWSRSDRAISWIQKFGQYFGIMSLSSIRKPSLRLEEEMEIYSKSAINVNIHEDYQRRFGGDCNERTFKIPLSGGFEVVDNVRCISNYFEPNKEIVIANSSDDWFEKIEFYSRHPIARKKIIDAGKKQVLHAHTYRHRVRKIISLVNNE